MDEWMHGWMLHGCMMDACSGIESTDAHDDMIYFQRATDRTVFADALAW